MIRSVNCPIISGLACKAGLSGASNTLITYSLRRMKSGRFNLVEGVLFKQEASGEESDTMVMTSFMSTTSACDSGVAMEPITQLLLIVTRTSDSLKKYTFNSFDLETAVA